MVTIYDLAKLSESQIVAYLSTLPVPQVQALLADAQRAAGNERAAGLGSLGSWLSKIIKGATKVLAPILGGGSQPVVVQVPTPAPAPAPEPSALEKSMPLILLGGGALVLLLLLRRR